MKNTLTVEEFKAMFREVGMDESGMKQWHRVFELRHPESHQSFLEWLGLTPAHIAKVRAESR